MPKRYTETMKIEEMYSEGDFVDSPYGYGEILEVKEPLDDYRDETVRANIDAEDLDDLWVAELYVFGHGVETIELEALTPVTPEIMAISKQTAAIDRLTQGVSEVADGVEDRVVQEALERGRERYTDKETGRRRQA